ncbi:MAG TPA: GDSL-type esterase/lipase family protein [Flavisolibacter sp.]|nr:GDSL-type esterase/lipase family protein [Flavisolibacter sp.]
MQSNYKLLLILICVFGFSCTSSKKNFQSNIVLKASDLQPYGRSILNKDNELELLSSAVHFGFSFKGSECTIYARIPGSDGHNYFQYELDGIYQKRIRIDATVEQPVSIKVPGNGTHTIWIFKATEATTGPIFIEKIEGNNIKPLSNPPAPSIEFIGNSITCGAASDTSEIPCNAGAYHDHHNAYLAYGPRVARALKVNFLLSSVSGIGVYRNWNSDGPAMPQVYEKIDFQPDTKQLWDFSKYNPKIVSIALGTNDFSNGDGIKKRPAFDSNIFVNEYIKFIQIIKTKYPGAQIALLSSPIFEGNNTLLLQRCLKEIKQNIDHLYPSGNRIELFFFQTLRGHGCTGHPSVEDHALLAKQLIPFFRKLMSS